MLVSVSKSKFCSLSFFIILILASASCRPKTSKIHAKQKSDTTNNIQVRITNKKDTSVITIKADSIIALLHQFANKKNEELKGSLDKTSDTIEKIDKSGKGIYSICGLIFGGIGLIVSFTRKLMNPIDKKSEDPIINNEQDGKSSNLIFNISSVVILISSGFIIYQVITFGVFILGVILKLAGYVIILFPVYLYVFIQYEKLKFEKKRYAKERS